MQIIRIPHGGFLKLMLGTSVFCVAIAAQVRIAEAGGCYSQGGYYSQGPYYSQATYQTTVTVNTTENINFAITGTLSKGAGTFVIDHPLDPKNKLLYHSFVESPDTKNWYDGIALLDANGEAIVTLPDYFLALNKDFRFELTPLGVAQPNLHIVGRVANNRFTIAGGVPNARVSWQITGNRHDPYIMAHPIVPVVKKGDDTPVRDGEFLFNDAVPQFPTHPFMVWLASIFGR